MALRTIRTIGDDVLTKPCKPIKEVTPRIKTLIEDMIETMRAADGVGIAAPQVGVLRRIAVVEVEDLYVLINPVITEREGDQFNEEACLSVPGRAGRVHRPTRIVCEAMTEMLVRLVGDVMMKALPLGLLTIWSCSTSLI